MARIMAKVEIVTLHVVQNTLRNVFHEELKEGGVLHDKSIDFAFKITIDYNDLLCNVAFSNVGKDGYITSKFKRVDGATFTCPV